MSDRGLGIVLFAYDGSDLARLAIEDAGQQLAPGRDAVVLTVWRPYAVGFRPAREVDFDAAAPNEVRTVAKETAAYGASLAEAAGFPTTSMEIEAAPTWKGICQVADERDAGLIVLGSHGKRGMAGVFLGSVAGAVAAHSPRTVLIAHKRTQELPG
jgi:nucleotide-binding universal stress UspA family protein